MDEYFEEKIQEVREDYWNQIREIRAEKEVLRKERDTLKKKNDGCITALIGLQDDRERLKKENTILKGRIKDVLELVNSCKALLEAMNVYDHLKEASNEVSKWPKDLQNMLGDSPKPIFKKEK